MAMDTFLKVGSRVKAHPKHWLYPGALGYVVQVNFKRGNAFLIKFDDPNGGLDGDSLWLDEESLKRVTCDL